MRQETRSLRYLLPAWLAIMMLVLPTLAQAYVGPSVAVSFFGATLGLLFGIFSAIGVLLLWPLKALLRILKRISADHRTPTESDEGAAT